MATRTFQAGEMVRKTTLKDVLADGLAGPRMPASVRAEALPSSMPSGYSPPPPLIAGFVSKRQGLFCKISPVTDITGRMEYMLFLYLHSFL